MSVEDYPLVDVARITRLTAPPCCRITTWQRNSEFVLVGDGDLLLLGSLGVNYYVERVEGQTYYLRRWDVPAAP